MKVPHCRTSVLENLADATEALATARLEAAMLKGLFAA
jgi:hypothetical protein